MKSVVCATLLVETSPQGLPLGAACIAGAIKNDFRTKGNFSVLLADFSLEENEIVLAFRSGGEKAVSLLLAGRLAAEKPDFACFSVYVWNRLILEETARELKKILPECVCMAGGPEVTADPLSFKWFDFMIAGQGERAIPELLSEISMSAREFVASDFPAGRAFGIQGVYAPQKNYSPGEIIRACPLPPENSVSPYLDGTLDPARYGGALWELARGCPFKCSYCYESKGERKITYFPMERLEKELELFVEKNIPQVFVLDPTYNASKERAIKMLEIIGRKAPGMFFYFEARAEFIDRELARAFSKISCCLQIGLQSSSPDVLKNVRRALDKKRFVKNIGFLNEEGVTFGFDLIYGLPGDDLKGFCDSIDFALSLYPNNLELFCLSVLPGTDLHDDARSFGLEWDKNPPYHVLRTPRFSAQDLKKAEELSFAANLFYTKGRAVAWFNPILYVLGEKPSVFLKKFALFLEGEPEDTDPSAAPIRDWTAEKNAAQIEETQIRFVKKRFHEKGLDDFFSAAEDLIRMHAALGRCVFDGSESVLTTSRHPDDVMSEYGADIEFLVRKCGRQECRVHVFPGENGPDWRTLKKSSSSPR